MKIAILFLILFSGLNQYAFAEVVPSPIAKASFDCQKAKSCEEKLICQLPELAQLDLKLSEHYKRAMTVLKDSRKTKLIAEQKKWLLQRGALGCSDQALVQHYRKRFSMIDYFLKKDPADLLICKRFQEQRNDFKLVAPLKQDGFKESLSFKFDLENDGRTENFNFTGSGTCPQMTGSYKDQKGQDQEIMDEDDSHSESMGITPKFFSLQGKLFVGEISFACEEDAMRTDRYLSLKQIKGRHVRKLCTFRRVASSWKLTGKNKKPCQLMSDKKIEKVYDLENEKVALANNGKLYRLGRHLDVVGTSAGCGSEIGTSYLYIVEKENPESDQPSEEPTEPGTLIGNEIKDFTWQQYLELNSHSIVKIGGHNYLMSVPNIESLDPRFDLPSRSLHEFLPSGKLVPVCAFEAQSKIVIDE